MGIVKYPMNRKHWKRDSLFVLCDAETSYINNFEIYTGKKDKVTKNLGGKTIMPRIIGIINDGLGYL